MSMSLRRGTPANAPRLKAGVIGPWGLAALVIGVTSPAIGLYATWAVGSLAARTQRSTIARAPAFLALILIPSLSSAAIYKCTAQDGSITYTDAPCPADMTTQYIDPAAPPWLNESSQTMNAIPGLPDAKSQSQPEILAVLCANSANVPEARSCAGDATAADTLTELMMIPSTMRGATLDMFSRPMR